jgi:hypothetical protein
VAELLSEVEFSDTIAVGHVHHVLESRDLRVHVLEMVLGKEADLAARMALDVTRGWLKTTLKETHEGGLARAVGTEETDLVSSTDAAGEVLEDRTSGGVGEGDVGKVDDGDVGRKRIKHLGKGKVDDLVWFLEGDRLSDSVFLLLESLAISCLLGSKTIEGSLSVLDETTEIAGGLVLAGRLHCRLGLGDRLLEVGTLLLLPVVELLLLVLVLLLAAVVAGDVSSVVEELSVLEDDRVSADLIEEALVVRDDDHDRVPADIITWS